MYVDTIDETDYTRISVALIDVVLIFDDATRRDCFLVRITDDDLVEGEEQFSLRILPDPFSPPPINTVLSPNMSIISIIDQDGKPFNVSMLCRLKHDSQFAYAEAVIGFFETNYTAGESEGVVTLQFGLISGRVQEPVEIALSLLDGSALGKVYPQQSVYPVGVIKLVLTCFLQL